MTRNLTESSNAERSGWRWSTSLETPEPFLKSIREVWKSRQDWTSAVLENDGSISDAIQRSAAHEAACLYVMNRSQVESQIVEYRNSKELRGDLRAKTALTDSLSAKRAWKDKRQASHEGQAGTVLQSTLSTIGNFLESFSGIVEIVKAADNQYGGLAYGTVSLLLSVAVQKQKREEAIEEALEELSHACPRLETLNSLDPTDKLRHHVADAFTQIIKFCRECTRYYSDKGKRIRDALSPKAQRMPALVAVHIALSRTRDEMDLVMFARIKQTQDKVHEMQIKLEDMERAVRRANALLCRSQRRDDQTDLARLGHLLNVTSPPSGILTTEIRKMLTAAFSEDRAGDAPRPITWDFLNEEQRFLDWLLREESCVLVAGGTNWSMADAGTLNWLSHVSVFVVQKLQSRSEPVAFFYCQRDWSISHSKSTFSEVMAGLLMQIGKEYIDIFTSKLEDIEAFAKRKPLQMQMSVYEETQQAINMLKFVLSELRETEGMTIVIDRLDQCCWSDSNFQQSEALEAVIECFLELMKSVKCRLKILIVISSASARALTHPSSASYLGRRAEGRYLCVADWVHESEYEHSARFIDY